MKKRLLVVKLLLVVVLIVGLTGCNKDSKEAKQAYYEKYFNDQKYEINIESLRVFNPEEITYGYYTNGKEKLLTYTNEITDKNYSIYYSDNKVYFQITTPIDVDGKTLEGFYYIEANESNKQKDKENSWGHLDDKGFDRMIFSQKETILNILSNIESTEYLQTNDGIDLVYAQVRNESSNISKGVHISIDNKTHEIISISYLKNGKENKTYELLPYYDEIVMSKDIEAAVEVSLEDFYKYLTSVSVDVIGH